MRPPVVGTRVSHSVVTTVSLGTRVPRSVVTPVPLSTVAHLHPPTPLHSHPLFASSGVCTGRARHSNTSRAIHSVLRQLNVCCTLVTASGRKPSTQTLDKTTIKRPICQATPASIAVSPSPCPSPSPSPPRAARSVERELRHCGRDIGSDGVAGGMPARGS